MNVKKTIRKVIPKEYRKKIKEKFNIQTVSDEVVKGHLKMSFFGH